DRRTAMKSSVIADPRAPQPTTSAPILTIVPAQSGSDADRDVIVAGVRDAWGEPLRLNDAPLTPAEARALLARLAALPSDAVRDLIDARLGLLPTLDLALF